MSFLTRPRLLNKSPSNPQGSDDESPPHFGRLEGHHQNKPSVQDSLFIPKAQLKRHAQYCNYLRSKHHTGRNITEFSNSFIQSKVLKIKPLNPSQTNKQIKQYSLPLSREQSPQEFLKTSRPVSTRKGSLFLKHNRRHQFGHPDSTTRSRLIDNFKYLIRESAKYFDNQTPRISKTQVLLNGNRSPNISQDKNSSRRRRTPLTPRQLFGSETVRQHSSTLIKPTYLTFGTYRTIQQRSQQVHQALIR